MLCLSRLSSYFADPGYVERARRAFNTAGFPSRAAGAGSDDRPRLSASALSRVAHRPGGGILGHCTRHCPTLPRSGRGRRPDPLAHAGPTQRKGKNMTVARITEISSVSNVSFQDAIEQGVARANKTLKNVKGAWVKDQEVSIDNGKVSGYKVILKVTFVLSD